MMIKCIGENCVCNGFIKFSLVFFCIIMFSRMFDIGILVLNCRVFDVCVKYCICKFVCCLNLCFNICVYCLLLLMSKIKEGVVILLLVVEWW